MMRPISLAAPFGALLLVGPALSHGDSDWIRTNPATSYCCGPTDCAPLADGQVVEERDGWLVLPFGQRLRQNDPNVFPSQDNRYWACRFPGQGIRCFFYPRPAT